MAIYRDGILLDIAFANLASQESNKITLALPENTQGCEVKAFIWESWDNLRPIIECVSLK